MKKLSLLFAFGAIIAFASCKKEYTCTCTTLLGDNPYDKTGKGKDAADACNDATTKVLGVPMEICTEKK